MNESMNESIHKNIKEKRNIKIKRLIKDHVVHQLKEIIFKIIFHCCKLTSLQVEHKRTNEHKNEKTYQRSDFSLA